MSKRVLLLGLDGYDPELAERYMAQGELPALRQLKSSSAEVALEHGPAKRTGLAWEHFATGLDPEAADRFSAVHFDAERYTCVQRGTRLTPFTKAYGADAVVFDAPYFDLSRTRGTRGLVAWGAHDPGVPLHATPASLSDEVMERFGAYPAPQWIYGHTWTCPVQTRQMGEDLVLATERRADIAEWMLGERFPDWRLGVVVVSEPHSAIEALWHGVDERHPLADMPSAEAAGTATLDVYRAVDRLVERLAHRFRDATIVAVSMHGMGPNHSDLASMALLPELMHREQFGEAWMDAPGCVATPPAGESWMDSVQRCYPTTTNTNGSCTEPQPLQPKRRQRSAAERQLRAWAKSLLNPVRHQRVEGTLDWMPASWYARHWRAMDVFALPSFYDGQLRVNLKGRERDGRVDVADYARMLDRVEALLAECTDVFTHQPVVESVVRNHREDPRDMGPSEADLIIVWNGIVSGLDHPRHGRIGPLPHRRPGGHTGGVGMAWVKDDAIQPGDRGLRSAFDVVPTLFDLTGQPPSPGLSGESFLDLLTTPSCA